MIPYNNVTIFVSLSWKIYILVHYQHFEDRQVNIYKVNININFSIFISCNKNETNIPLFQFQMMYLNYFLNKIVQRIKNFFSKKPLCKYNNNNGEGLAVLLLFLLCTPTVFLMYPHRYQLDCEMLWVTHDPGNYSDLRR